MKKKPEKKFEDRVIAELNALGWFAHHFDVNGLDGFYDVLAFKGDRYIALELKAGTQLRQDQIAFAKRMEEKHDILAYYIVEHKTQIFAAVGITSGQELPKPNAIFGDLKSAIKWVTL